MNDANTQEIRTVLREELNILLAPILEFMEETSNTLNEHTVILHQHTKKLDEHTRKLDEHTRKLDEHSERFERIDGSLVDIENRLDGYADMYKINAEKNGVLGERVGKIEKRLGFSS
jgi:hypothetical protein